MKYLIILNTSKVGANTSKVGVNTSKVGVNRRGDKKCLKKK